MGMTNWLLSLGLGLDLIQTYMAQKPLMWVEAGAHSVVGWGGQVAGAGVVCRLGVCAVFEAAGLSGVVSFLELELELLVIQTHMAQKPLLWVEVGFFVWCSPAGGCVQSTAGFLDSTTLEHASL
jgi:hypothetical protein